MLTLTHRAQFAGPLHQLFINKGVEKGQAPDHQDQLEVGDAGSPVRHGGGVAGDGTFPGDGSTLVRQY